MNSILLRGAGRSLHTPSSFTSTSSPRAGTLRPGNSRGSFQKRFVQASDHCDRAWQRLPHNLIAAKTGLVCTLPQESADDRALLSSPELDSEKTNAKRKGGKNMANPTYEVRANDA